MTSSRSDIPAGWTEDRFTDLTVRESRGQIPKASKSIYQTSGAFPVVDQGQELIAGFVDSDELRFRGRLPAIVFGDHTRIFKYVNFPFVAGADGTRIVTPLSDRVDVSFFYYALCNLPLKNLGYSRHFKLLKEQIVRFPESVREQRKIAAILSSVDDAIEKTRAVIDQVQVVKRGLMQELLTRGLPGRHTRFKQTEIGKIPEEWGLSPLEQFIESGPDNGLYRPQSEYGEGIPIVRIDAFNDGDLLRGPNLRRVSISPADVARFIVRPGDILINRVNSLSHLAKCALAVSFDEPTVYESNMMRLTLDSSRVVPEFGFRWLLSEQVKKHLTRRAKRAVAQASVNQNDVRTIPTPCPPRSEQLYIAGVVGSVEQRMETETGALAVLNEVKSALMSVLLTGELRVTPDPDVA